MQSLRQELVLQARQLLPDHPEDAEDAVQDVLEALCRRRRNILNPRAYAHAALRWRCAAIGQRVRLDPLELLDHAPWRQLAA